MTSDINDIPFVLLILNIAIDITLIIGSSLNIGNLHNEKVLKIATFVKKKNC